MGTARQPKPRCIGNDVTSIAYALCALDYEAAQQVRATSWPGWRLVGVGLAIQRGDAHLCHGRVNAWADGGGAPFVPSLRTFGGGAL
jgi:hypothetical protein